MAHNPETEVRIEELCKRMRALEWVRGETGQEYATKWGITLDRVERLSAEAWKRVKAEVTDVDRVTTKVSLVLETMIDEALKDTREPALIDGGGPRGVYQESPNGARRVVVEAAKTWAALVGANAATKVDVSVGGPTPSQAAKLMREAFGAVTPDASSATDVTSEASPAEPDDGDAA